MRHDLHPPSADIDVLVGLALAEDLTPFGDLTSGLLDPSTTATAEFRAREAGVLAGTRCVEATCRAVDPALRVEWQVAEGGALAPGTVAGVARGPLATMLTAERTALNFLGHLSGIATNAARWVEIAAGRVTVWDTRKTLPGYRSLQKAAVRAGGASNHRGNLSDWLMLKDNHLTDLSISEAVARAKALWPGRTIHVEADREEQMIEAIEAGASIILLDNFSPEELPALVATAGDVAARAGVPRPLLEASGGITIDTLDAYAATGVDLVSSGSITNSATVLDLGLDVVVD